MGILGSLFTGHSDPVVEFAVSPPENPPSVTPDLISSTSIPAEMFGLSSYSESFAPAPRLTRREAMSVAAVKRGRDLICSALAPLPLVTVKADETTERTSWLLQPERDVPRSVTIARTIEDLIFEGVAWWIVKSYDWRGRPAQVVRLEPRSVNVLKDGRVHVTTEGRRGIANEYPTARELIRFDSPNDALLVAGARSIRQCLRLDTAASRYADGSPPIDYFTPVEGADPAEDDDVVAILNDWQRARRTRSTGYVPAALKYNVAGWDPEKLQLAEARQHAVLEIARAMGVDPEELGVSTTSRTYANQFDRRKNFVDFTLGGYRSAIEDRLSMDDVTPHGTSVRFDLSEFLRSDDRSRIEVAALAHEKGLISRPEARRYFDSRLPVDLDAPATPQAVEPIKEVAR